MLWGSRADGSCWYVQGWLEFGCVSVTFPLIPASGCLDRVPAKFLNEAKLKGQGEATAGAKRSCWMAVAAGNVFDLIFSGSHLFPHTN